MQLSKEFRGAVQKLKLAQWMARHKFSVAIRRNPAIARFGRFLRNKAKARQLLKWIPVDAAEYREVYNRLGGSLAVHPDAVAILAEIRDVPVDYRVLKADGRTVAALPLWPEGIVGANATLKACGCEDIMDLGDGELILPLDASWALQQPMTVPGGAGMLSEVHQGELTGLSACELPMMLARGHVSGLEPFSGATLSKRRRDLNKFLKDGGTISTFQDYSPAKLAAMYREIFLLQRGTPPPASQHLERAFSGLSGLLHGHVLHMNGELAAMKLNFAMESPRALIVVGVNGGVNPAYRDRYQPGSILNYLNVKSAEERAVEKGLPLRFCFGWGDHAYKSDVCRGVTAWTC